MQNRKQSVVTLSFQNDRETRRGYFSRAEPKPEKSEIQKPSSKENDRLGKDLMELCREIAGALLCRYSTGEEAAISRRIILEGLMKTVECDRFQAERLLELSRELIHVHAYGTYRHNAVELSLLIAQATGQQKEMGSN